MKFLFIRRPPLAIPLLNRLPTSYSHSVATTGPGGKLSKFGPRLMSRDINRNYMISSVLTFKEISLNYGNLDLFKEIFKEMDFLRNS